MNTKFLRLYKLGYTAGMFLGASALAVGTSPRPPSTPIYYTTTVQELARVKCDSNQYTMGRCDVPPAAATYEVQVTGQASAAKSTGASAKPVSSGCPDGMIGIDAKCYAANTFVNADGNPIPLASGGTAVESSKVVVQSRGTANPQAASGTQGITFEPPALQPNDVASKVLNSSPKAFDPSKVSIANDQLMKDAFNHAQVNAANTCLQNLHSINSTTSASTCELPTKAGDVITPVDTGPQPANTCSARRVSIPGSKGYSGEFLEKVVSAPDEKPPALYGVRANLGTDAVLAHKDGVYVNKSTDGGKTWMQVARLESDKYTASDGLYNALSVSKDGSSIVVTTQKGAFPLNRSGDHYDVSQTPLAGPGANPMPAGPVTMSSDGTKMAVSYGFYESDSPVQTYHKEGNAWVPDKASDGTLLTTHLRTQDNSDHKSTFSLQYDPNGKLYAGTGNQLYTLDDHNTWKVQTIRLPYTGVNKKTGQKETVVRRVDDVTVYGITFAKSGDANHPVSSPARAATCWGTINLQNPGISRGRAYSIEASEANPDHVVRATSKGVDISRDGGKSWTSVDSLPQCSSTKDLGVAFSSQNSAECDRLVNHSALQHDAKGNIIWPKKFDPNIVRSEFRTAHFNPDGSLVMSGPSGTYVADPFNAACKAN